MRTRRVSRYRAQEVDAYCAKLPLSGESRRHVQEKINVGGHKEQPRPSREGSQMFSGQNPNQRDKKQQPIHPATQVWSYHMTHLRGADTSQASTSTHRSEQEKKTRREIAQEACCPKVSPPNHARCARSSATHPLLACEKKQHGNGALEWIKL